jgi:aryl-alcohol dehydrogenase-like predicted oxidoreductase
MSWAYGAADDTESLRVLRRSLELGMNFWDTAEIYGPFKNEELLGRALREVGRDKVIVATKFAWRFGPSGEMVALDGSRANIRRAIEASLKRLGTDHIDLFYQHRLDPQTPIEDTVGAMAELVKEGKVRQLGLSEVGPKTIRRAHAVHPIAAIQSEYSLWERGVEKSILPTLKELGIGFVAYSPIGRGFLSGRYKSPDDLEASDWRRGNPRFAAEAFTHNLELVEAVKRIAGKHAATPAQVALAWLLRQGVAPIPGTKHVSYLEENARAAELSLPEAAWDEANAVLARFETAGARYPEAAMKTLDSSE